MCRYHRLSEVMDQGLRIHNCDNYLVSCKLIVFWVQSYLPFTQFVDNLCKMN